MRAILFFIAFVTAMTSAGLPTRADTTAPAQFVKSFYVWYLSGLSLPSRDFMSPRTDLTRYITSGLLRRLRYAQTHSGDTGLDIDYFMQAQDLDPAFRAKHIPGWPSRIKTSVFGFADGAATVAVTFKGVYFDDKLRVRIIRTNGEWRIDSIKSLQQ